MKTSIIFSSLIILFFSASAQYHYPPTKMEDSTNTYFGITYHDPYRWLEHIETPEVGTWFKQQANYTDSILNTLNGRDELIQEWKKLDALQPPKISSRVEENGRIFYRKTMPGESVGKLYYRQGVNGEEVLLFDPSNYIPGKTLSIQKIAPDYDGKKVALTYTEEGAEIGTLKILDVDSKQFLKDSIYPVAWHDDWTFDNTAIFYEWIKSADNRDPASRLNPKTKLHTIGTPSTTDKDFFSNESYPDLHIAPKVYPFIILNGGAKNYIFAREFTLQNELKEYYAPIENAYKAKIDWKILCSPDDKIVHDEEETYKEMPGIAMIGDTIYAITYKNAKNQKLVATSLKKLDWENAKTIAPEKKDLILKTFSYSKDYLFLLYSDGINSHISKYNLKTRKTSKVTLPYSGTASIFCLDTKTNKCTLRISSWNLPPVEFDYNPDTDIFTAGSFNKPPSYPDAYKNLEVKEVEVKGHDGAMIPLSIIYKKGTQLDNSNVCFMYTYGAYGFTVSPHFIVYLMTLATKGVVIAIPHVRGGGAKGEAWHKAGYKSTKPNTWKDFISCAEYLIENGYTSKKKLAGMGTSAGGVLISRAITERPDLFAAAVCNVGVANAMRVEFSANGPVDIPEFGTVKDSVECKALYEMDGMQHVVKGTKYPAVICVGGWNDERVVAWQPGKFAAALQNASTSGKPVLMKVNYDNGHFTEDKNVTDANFADQLAFAMWQCGHPDFQPKK